MAAVSFRSGAAMVARLRPGRAAARSRSPFAPLSFSISSSSNEQPQQQKQLVLYSKPGCCLCDGLKEKLHAALSLDGPHSLSSVQLQVRDITENPEWERLYQYEIPVLAKLLPDGTEEALPRFSPRISVELVQKKIAASFEL